MSYNVLTQKWIPVHTLDGDFDKIGILDVITNAHKLKCIAAESPVVTYSIYRLIIMLLMDLYRPEQTSDLRDIYRSARFEEERLTRYIDLCNEHGERFDLLDEEHPFLQQAEFYPPSTKKDSEESYIKTEPISKLFVQLPFGNNHIHFSHSMENSHVFSPEDCAKILCTVPLFFARYNKGAYFGITGQPPVFFLVGKDNLFDTLALSMFTRSQISGIQDWGLPLWRQNEQKKTLHPITIMDGLYSPARQIRILQEIDSQTESIVVKDMMYAEGVHYKPIFEQKDSFVWEDPHACYYLSKNEKKVFRYRNKAIWQDLGTVLDAKSKPSILQNASKILSRADREKIDLYSYCLVTEFKTVWMPVTWFSEEIPLFAGILDDEEAIDVLKQTLELTNSIYNKFVYVIGDGEFAIHAQSVAQQFLHEIRSYIFGTLMNRLQETTQDSMVNSEIATAASTIAYKVFDEFIGGIGTSAKTLKWAALAKNKFTREVYGLLKKGGYISDDRKSE